MTQPPGPSGPYGAGGYGQQPPGPGGGPYGPPQGPGFGAPGPYGGWPPAPPPRRRGLSSGAITAIVLGSLAAVGVVLFALAALVRAGQPQGTEKIAFPSTLEDGKYHRMDGNAQVEAQERQLQDKLPSNGTAKVATYSASSSGDPTAGGLAIAGAYGDIDVSSAKMRDDMLDGMRQSQSGEVVGGRREFTPGSGEVEVSCQLTRIAQGSTAVYAPACAWADHSTAATVLEIDLANTSPGDVDLEEFASVTARVKDKVTMPK
ncbi:hypothetical protein ITI46_08360 [Streptomyces oryzae]|uniref:Tat pathway signal sequence domain protein n=1 Tax=Streptomyces oryzae TaxID=1434886 RepID=A0ABS3X9C5_9ACTN|nr:hypothetical protein [Streptomyces oryzae]MBO8191691.1 hypothetical protein [Streptomyces oryzae]